MRLLLFRSSKSSCLYYAFFSLSGYKLIIFILGLYVNFRATTNGNNSGGFVNLINH